MRHVSSILAIASIKLTGGSARFSMAVIVGLEAAGARGMSAFGVGELPLTEFDIYVSGNIDTLCNIEGGFLQFDRDVDAFCDIEGRFLWGLRGNLIH